MTEEGLTNGKIERNKGRFAEAYSFSIDSGLLLRRYLDYVTAQARIEFQSGSQNETISSKIIPVTFAIPIAAECLLPLISELSR